jgi:hypothetical protein
VQLNAAASFHMRSKGYTLKAWLEAIEPRFCPIGDMSEILKGLWGKLYAWGLPSALALGATWLFLLPQLTSGFLGLVVGRLEGGEALLFLALTGALAVSLSSLSTQLYRLLEGYLWPRWLQEWGLKRQRAQKKALQAAAVGGGWRHGIALEELTWTTVKLSPPGLETP